MILFAVMQKKGGSRLTAWNIPARKARSPLKDAGFLLRVFPRERRYAELGYLLPFYFGRR